MSKQSRDAGAWRRDQILSAVGFVANVFLRSANWKDGLDAALERLGESALANRAYYFENRTRHDGALLTSQVAEWAAPGIEPQIHNSDLQNVPYVEAGMSRWVQVMSERKPIHGLIADFPEAERAILEAQDIRSLVAMPVFAREKFVGFLGFDDCEDLREWEAPELDALSTAAASMGAAIERQFLENQMRFAQKMDAVGSLAAGVAHDFNNMLQAIVGLTNLAKAKIDENHSAQKDLDEIMVASDRADSLTRQLLIFSRNQDAKPQIVNLRELCESVVAMIKPLVRGSIDLSVEVADSPDILADEGLFSQVLVNLCLNARDAMPSGGELKVSCVPEDVNPTPMDSRSGIQPGRYACLTVSDTGCGITPEVKERIFEPFFTTKGTEKGTGLGLSVVYGTVKQCGGFIDVKSAPGKGAQFRVFVPVAEKAKSMVNQPSPATRGNETILLVDDEKMVVDTLRKALHAAGYNVLTAMNGEAALRNYKENPEIALVITDSSMPGMDGETLLGKIRELDSATKSILISGFIANPNDAMHSRENHLVLQKPFRTKKLYATIRQLLDEQT